MFRHELKSTLGNRRMTRGGGWGGQRGLISEQYSSMARAFIDSLFYFLRRPPGRDGFFGSGIPGMLVFIQSKYFDLIRPSRQVILPERSGRRTELSCRIKKKFSYVTPSRPHPNWLFRDNSKRPEFPCLPKMQINVNLV
jgi:hypothetical protein